MNTRRNFGRRHLLLAALLMTTTFAVAEVKTATYQTTIHCDNCEQRIKKNVRFEKGVKKIDVNLATKIVTITYDDAKTDVTRLAAAIEKLGYKAQLVPQGTPEDDKK